MCFNINWLSWFHSYSKRALLKRAALMRSGIWLFKSTDQWCKICSYNGLKKRISKNCCYLLATCCTIATCKWLKLYIDLHWKIINRHQAYLLAIYCSLWLMAFASHNYVVSVSIPVHRNPMWTFPFYSISVNDSLYQVFGNRVF